MLSVYRCYYHVRVTKVLIYHKIILLFLFGFLQLMCKQLSTRIMLFRNPPFFRYHGVPSWPPVWTRTDGVENNRPQGEIGVLRTVQPSNVQPANRCFLHMDHEGSSYIGCLIVDDQAFCDHVVQLLQGCCNRPIAEIGNIELSHTF